MASKAISLLKSAKRHGIHISVDNGNLQLKLSRSVDIDPLLLDEIKTHKKDIIDFLSNAAWKSSKVDEDTNVIRPHDRNGIDRIPLSFSQERLWFIDQLEGSTHYHIPIVLRLSGQLKPDALSRAFQALLHRHEVLRCVYYEENGIPYQRLMDEQAWDLSIHNAAHLQQDPSGLQDYIQALIDQPFELARDYMLRAHLLQLRADSHLLLVTLHHIACDGWSVPIITRELSALYNHLLLHPLH
ncbi:MAG: hypothetical protein INR73_27415, partial [Williamsia sp.]|nr:hypothetical protein [Williamsia sp.]